MKVEYLVNQAKRYLPLLTDKFSDNIKIKKVEVVEGQFTVTLSEDINIKKGEEAIIFVKNIPLKIDIESIDKISSEEAILITKQNHNQTKNPTLNYKVYINIQGCGDKLYNKKTEVLEDYQDGGFKLRIKADKEASEKPDVSNAFFYINNCMKGNGLKRVKIINKNTFTFSENDNSLNYTVEDIEGMAISMNTRIYPAYDFNDAKAQFDRNMQKKLEEDIINKEYKPIIEMKKSEDFTAFIALDSDVKNTAPNDTSVGIYNYRFFVYTFIMHRNLDKYKIRDFEDILLHKVFNRIFGEKTLLLTDNLLSVNRTQKIKSLGSSFAEQRKNDLSIIQFEYELRIQTFIDDYNLPSCDVRLNGLDMSITNRDSKNYSKINILC